MNVFDSFKSSSGISDCCSSSGSDVIASDVIEVITIDGGSSDSTRISVSSGVICVCDSVSMTISKAKQTKQK
jgi:hypothetical protein